MTTAAILRRVVIVQGISDHAGLILLVTGEHVPRIRVFVRDALPPDLAHAVEYYDRAADYATAAQARGPLFAQLSLEAVRTVLIEEGIGVETHPAYPQECLDLGVLLRNDRTSGVAGLGE